MTSKRRPENIAFPRQIAMFLSRQLTESSLNAIGEAFGGRDHGTVLHACRLVKDRMEVDPSVRQIVLLSGKAASTLILMAPRQSSRGNPPGMENSLQPVTPVIQVQGLTKTYRTYKKKPGLRGAVRGLSAASTKRSSRPTTSASISREGELVGFLGPNGAGKTTTLKMLSGLLYPTTGRAQVLGYVPWERRMATAGSLRFCSDKRTSCGGTCRPGNRSNSTANLWDRVDAFERTVAEMTELLGVADKLNVMVRELSLGERMKMELIAALLHRPKVLFLDEPTIGLDVVSQKTVREFLRHHNTTRKTTILLTSHYMADIEELCQRVIIIDRGKIFFDGQLTDVLDRFANFKIITIHRAGLADNAAENPGRFGDVMEHTPATIKLRVRAGSRYPCVQSPIG